MTAAILKRGREVRIVDRETARKLIADFWYVVAYIRLGDVIPLEAAA
jgi:hypothetical protein